MNIFHEFDNANCHKLCVNEEEIEVEGNIVNFDEPAFVEVGDTTFIGLSEYWNNKAGVYQAKKCHCYRDHENDFGGHVEMYLEQEV